jgi:hypothetical protein
VRLFFFGRGVETRRRRDQAYGGAVYWNKEFFFLMKYRIYPEEYPAGLTTG